MHDSDSIRGSQARHPAAPFPQIPAGSSQARTNAFESCLVSLEPFRLIPEAWKNPSKMKSTPGNSTPTFTLRQMVATDQSSVVAIIHAFHPFDGAAAKVYFQRFFADRERLSSEHEKNFVAESENGEVLGTCGLTPNKYHTLGICWLSWFYVKKSSRGHGVGGALLQHTLRLAGELDIRKVYLDTSSDAIYERSTEVYVNVGF